jgi:hypothetical protein
MKKFRKNLILIGITYLFIYTGNSYSQEETKAVFSSRFCTVFYENEVDLGVVNKRINLEFSDFYSSRNYNESPGISLEDMIAEKFDSIFNKAEEILDMHPARIHVAINIYKRQEGLNKAYEEFFKEPNTAVSFYIYKTNTIYTMESAINANILSHEMAHCIIDHYFVILPPTKIQEMLAAYVDAHLKDQ